MNADYDSLEKCYVRLLRERVLPDHVQKRMWQMWLWGTDVNQPLIDECGDMNVNQGVGVFLCVMLSYSLGAGNDDECIGDLLPHCPLVHLSKTPVRALTQRQLLDQVECLQLSWGNVVGSHEHLEGRCRKLLCMLMARLGFMAHHAYAGAPSPLDAIQYTTILPNCNSTAGGSPLYIVTRKYTRQMCCLFVILFRTLHITSKAEVAPSVDEQSASLIRGAFQVKYFALNSYMLAFDINNVH